MHYYVQNSEANISLHGGIFCFQRMIEEIALLCACIGRKEAGTVPQCATQARHVRNAMEMWVHVRHGGRHKDNQAPAIPGRSRAVRVHALEIVEMPEDHRVLSDSWNVWTDRGTVHVRDMSSRTSPAQGGTQERCFSSVILNQGTAAVNHSLICFAMSVVAAGEWQCL